MLAPTGRPRRPARPWEAGLRPGRFAAAAAGSALVIGATMALAGASAGAAAAPARVASQAAGPAVLISPDVVHAARAMAGPPSTAYCEQHYKIACYLPGQIEQAYGLPGAVRAGHHRRGPDDRHRRLVRLADRRPRPGRVRQGRTGSRPRRRCGSSSRPARCRPTSRPTTASGGPARLTLDVEYAHAIAPGASILLVETPTSENEGTTGFPQIVTAEKYVISHHLGGVISQSFSATEQTFPTRASLLNLRGAYTAAAATGVTVLAASGDSGAADVKFDGSTYYLHPVTSWPDSDPLVTGVGGTQLHLAAAGAPRPGHGVERHLQRADQRVRLRHRRPEPAGGRRRQVGHLRPAGLPGQRRRGRRQPAGRPRHLDERGLQRLGRHVPELRRAAGGWYPTCGTSEATPEFAGIVALADQVAGHPLGLINPALYTLSLERAPGIADVTRGNNTVTFAQDGTTSTVDGIQCPAGLRPGLRGGHRVGAAVRAGAGLRGERAPVSGSR